MKRAWKAAAWGLVLWGGAQLAALVFASNETAAVAAQAALAAWGAGHVGVTWSDPLVALPPWSAVARRAARGAGLGAAAAALVVVAALATHGARFFPGAPGAGALVVGLLVAALGAVRDELLLRGVVLRATREVLPAWATLPACGAVAASARWGVDGTVGLVLAVEGLRAVALGALWLRDRGAWMAWGANAAWMWGLGALTHGGLLDVRFVAEPEAGVAALLVVALAAMGAGVAAYRTGHPTARS
jgi:hypothetical protein